MKKLLLFIILIFSSAVMSGEIISKDDPSREFGSCYQDDISPLTNNLNVCPINDEEFDEFDAIECTCQLPPDPKKISRVADRIHKNIGKMYLDNYKHTLDKFSKIWKQADEVGAEFDKEQNKLCSFKTFDQIIGKRAQLPSSDKHHCSSKIIDQNLKKYFDSDIRELFIQVAGDRNQSVSGVSAFKQPLSKNNHKQCLSEGRGVSLLEELMAKYQNKEKGKSKPEVELEIQKMQSHCGFMFSSLADLVCNQNSAKNVSNQKFFEKRMEHDPFDADLENDDYFAVQSFYCSGIKEEPKNDEVNPSKKCQNLENFDSLEKLMKPIVSTKNIDDVITCNGHFLGSIDFLNGYEANSMQVSDNLEGVTDFTCSLLNCANTDQLLTKDSSSFNCVARSAENQLLASVVDLAKIQCTTANNTFCFEGRFKPKYLAATELLIKECLLMDCMKAEDLQTHFSHVIEQKPELENLIMTSRYDLQNKKSASEEFWDHFYGQSDSLAKVENLDTETYIAAVNAGMGSDKGEVKPIHQANESLVDNNVNEGSSETTTDVVAKSEFIESENVSERSDGFRPTFSAGTNDPQLEILDRELQINEELQDSLKDLKIFQEQLANSAAGSEQRDRAFQEIGRAQERVAGLQRDFQALKEREQAAGIKSEDTFEERFSDTLANVDFPGNIFGGQSNSQDLASRNQYDFSSNNASAGNKLKAGRVQGQTSARNSARRQDEREAVAKTKPQAVRPGLPQINNAGANSTVLTEQTGGRGPASVSTGSAKSASLKGKDLALANNLTDESLAKSDLKLESTYQAEVIVDPRKQEIDLLDELLKYKKIHPEFQLGHVLTIKQMDKNIGTYKKTRLIPTFGSDGSFSGYGISADKNMRSQLVVREYDKIKFRDLSRSEAYQLEMDIIVAQR